MKKFITEGSELDGFDRQRLEDKAKVVKAWQDGHVSNEDIPETARKPAEEDGADSEEKQKLKKAKMTLARIKAWQDGYVTDEDIAETAEEDGAEEKPKNAKKTLLHDTDVFLELEIIDLNFEKLSLNPPLKFYGLKPLKFRFWLQIVDLKKKKKKKR